jgi:hypothetical protein
MDVRIETFMRDIASDKGMPLPALAERTTLRLGLALNALRRDLGPTAAAQRERQFFADLDLRIRDEADRYVGTRTQAHLLTVLSAVRDYAEDEAPEQRAA